MLDRADPGLARRDEEASVLCFGPALRIHPGQSTVLCAGYCYGTRPVAGTILTWYLRRWQIPRRSA